MSKMAGTKRTNDTTDPKASKKAKTTKDAPKQSKAVSTKSDSLKDDFMRFDEADNGDAPAAGDGKSKKQKEKYRPQVYKPPKKPEPYLSGECNGKLFNKGLVFADLSLLQGLPPAKPMRSKRHSLKIESPPNPMLTRSRGPRRFGNGCVANLMFQRKNGTRWSKNCSRSYQEG